MNRSNGVRPSNAEEKSVLLNQYIVKTFKATKNKTIVEFSISQPYLFNITIYNADNIKFTSTFTIADAQVITEKPLPSPVTKPVQILGSQI